MTPCNDSHENNSSEPSGRTLRHAFGKKGKNSEGERALGGKEGKGPQQGKVPKDLREEKGEDLRGGKALGGKGGKGSEQGKGGKDLREEKIWGQRP